MINTKRNDDSGRAMNAVFRLSNVSVSREALEAALGEPVSRFERNRSGALYYAQIDVQDETDQWVPIHSVLTRVGPKISRLVELGSLTEANLDIAILFQEGRVTTSLVLPSSVLHVLGQCSIDLQVSVYLTSDEA